MVCVFFKISAIPLDVNILPECSNDPRVVSNLIDGVNRTQDDMHIWLAPFDLGRSHLITVEFFEVTTVAMIRIWVSKMEYCTNFHIITCFFFRTITNLGYTLIEA